MKAMKQKKQLKGTNLSYLLFLTGMIIFCCCTQPQGKESKMHIEQAVNRALFDYDTVALAKIVRQGNERLAIKELMKFLDDTTKIYTIDGTKKIDVASSRIEPSRYFVGVRAFCFIDALILDIENGLNCFHCYFLKIPSSGEFNRINSLTDTKSRVQSWYNETINQTSEEQKKIWTESYRMKILAKFHIRYPGIYPD